MARVIHIDLTPGGIDRAISELKRFQEDLKKALDDLMVALKDDGVAEAKMHILAFMAVDTGELLGSVEGAYDPQTHIAIIRAGADYAAFVEYGTGVVGQGSPHPAPVLLWKYDIHGHGEAGWEYVSPRDGKLHWTQGQPSRPFMYRTAERLRDKAPELAKRILSRL